MMWVIIMIIILVLLMILVLKMTQKYHITWYWCQNISLSLYGTLLGVGMAMRMCRWANMQNYEYASHAHVKICMCNAHVTHTKMVQKGLKWVKARVQNGVMFFICAICAFMHMIYAYIRMSKIGAWPWPWPIYQSANTVIHSYKAAMVMVITLYIKVTSDNHYVYAQKFHWKCRTAFCLSVCFQVLILGGWTVNTLLARVRLTHRDWAVKKVGFHDIIMILFD